MYPNRRRLLLLANRRNNTIATGTSYLLKQNFEGSGYDNGETWTTSGPGTINPDYTATVLEGSQSLLISTSSSTAQVISPSFTLQNEIWVYFLLRPVTIEASIRQLFGVRDSNDSTRWAIQVNADGTLRAVMNTVATTVGALSINTTYHIWGYFKTGSGANSVSQVAFSTNGIKPLSGNNFAETNSGNVTTQIKSIILGQGADVSHAYIFDKIRVSNTVIGDNPD